MVVTLVCVFFWLEDFVQPFSPPGAAVPNNKRRTNAPPTTRISAIVIGGRSRSRVADSTDDNGASIIKRKKGVAETCLAAILMTSAVVAVPWGLEFQPSKETHQSYTPTATAVPPVISLQRSQAWALSEEQMLVDEVWKEVTRQFVDQTFAGQGEEKWRQKRLEAVKKATGLTPDDREQVYAIIRTMLEPLKDPYTRYLTPEQYESLTNYATGKSTTGIGVQLMGDPKTGDIIVVNTVSDGPAQKAGVLPGDIVVEIDGMELQGVTAEVAAAKCRGKVGSQVTLALRHGGVGKPQESVTQLSVTRAPIPNNPVQVSTFKTANGKQAGLIKLSSFSQETVKQVTEALGQIQSKSSALVVDLRGNAGGYMPAGVDVAKLFLPPKSRIVSEVDKSGRATIYFSEGVGSETNLPLYVLVDKRTASASEIMAAALQDNHRATIVGSSATFGKGRIQNVQQLSEGGVAVTKAKYLSPDGKDIQGIGISPDRKSSHCESTDSAAVCLNDIL